MSKIKILIVEDQTLIALSLKRDIEKLGYEVTNAVTNYEDAIKSFNENEPNIILMDIDLGKDKKTGIDTAIAIKEIKDVAVIYTTAFSDEDTVLKASQTNPSAYLTKPYNASDLSSNILLAKYKMNPPKETSKEDTLTHLGDGYYYDSKNENLYFEDEPIQLSLKERKLLKILFNAKGNIVSRNDIEYIIWPDGPVSESTLRTLLYRLRGKLEHKFIETTTSFGIKLTIN